MTAVFAAVFLFSPHKAAALDSHASSPDGMIQRRDMAGRNILLPASPERVVGLSASIIEIIFELGKGSKIVGAVSHSDYPEEAKTLPVLGPYSKPDLEKLVAIKPDLCIAMKDGNPEDSVRMIESFGIPVFVVDTSCLSGIYEAIFSIGQILGAEAEASRIKKSMETKISYVREKVLKAKRPGVVFEVNSEPLILAGKGTFIDEMINLAGGTNLIRQGADYPRLSREKAVVLMPEVVIISGMVEEKRTRAWWRNFSYVPAVKNNRIYHVSPDVFLRPTPRMAGCIEELAKIMHPELF